MAYTRTQWNNLQKRLPLEDRTSYEDYLSTQPKATPAPTSGVISGFTPQVAMPASTLSPGDSGFVGPVAPKAPSSKGPLGGLEAGVIAGVKPTKGPWVKAGVVETIGGPVSVNSDGFAAFITVPKEINFP